MEEEEGEGAKGSLDVASWRFVRSEFKKAGSGFLRSARVRSKSLEDMI